MADKLTVFQKLGRVLGGEANTPTYVIDPKSFDNLDSTLANEIKTLYSEDVEIYNFMSAWQAGSVSDLKSGLKDVASKVSSILSRNY